MKEDSELRDNPAKYSDELFPVFQEALKIHRRVLDPFAGTGRIHRLQETLGIQTVGIELEAEWQAHHPATMLGDATDLPFNENTFDAICTSPTYGNRMADHHDAKDKSKRYTYRGYLGRPLSANNTGQLQWGAKYREVHTRAWIEARRVLSHGGVFVLNIKDHEREGERMYVADWHCATLEKLGFALQWWVNVPTKHNGNGANQGKKYPEQVYVFRKQRPTRREYDAAKKTVGKRIEITGKEKSNG